LSETTHTSYRLTEATRQKLAELAKLDGITSAQVINNLVQAEHRYRRADIEKMNALLEAAAETEKRPGK